MAANDIKEERREESAKKGKQMHDGLTFGKQERKNDQSHLSPPLFFSFTCSDAAFERKREREGGRERVWETERENEREREDEGSELRESKRTKRERERGRSTQRIGQHDVWQERKFQSNDLTVQRLEKRRTTSVKRLNALDKLSDARASLLSLSLCSSLPLFLERVTGNSCSSFLDE